ncbi:MAG: hypothetical protein NTZ65_03005 [Candidatus Berkelbacteria bacterium]|nr:hypothetical protein [Candidatus Berkelbacteria bacterium]
MSNKVNAGVVSFALGAIIFYGSLQVPPSASADSLGVNNNVLVLFKYSFLFGILLIALSFALFIWAIVESGK